MLDLSLKTHVHCVDWLGLLMGNSLSVRML